MPADSPASNIAETLASRSELLEQQLREGDELLTMAEHAAGIGVWDIDLEQQTVSGDDISFAFTIDPISRNQLLNGWDDVDLTESYREQIATFKTKDKTIRPWAAPTAKP